MERAAVKPARTFENVAARIREMISEGELKPGDKLPAERELSARLGVGRNAVREGLRTLEQAGLLQFRLGKSGGAFVTSGRPDVIGENMRDLLHLGNISFDDLWETRLLLSDVVVALAVERMDEADLAALEANVARTKALLEAGRLSEKSHSNIEFHDVLARATKNPMIAVIMSSMTDLVRHFIEKLGSDPSSATLESRYRLLAALRARNVEKATAEMRRDLRRVHTFYRKLARAAAAGSGAKPKPPRRPGRRATPDA